MGFTKILLDGDATTEVQAADPLSLAGVVNFAKNINLTKGTSANIDANDEIVVPAVSWLYLTSAGATDNLDGIGAGVEGQLVFLTVVAGKDITLVHNGTVTTGKKLMINGEANVTLDEDHDVAIAIYDATATVWDVIVPGSGGGGGGATTELDNLGVVAINTSLISDTDDTDDLGSAAKAWKDLHVGHIGLGGTNVEAIVALKWSPTFDPLSVSQIGILLNPTGQPDSNSKSITALQGTAIIKPDANTTGHGVAGLNFTASYWANGANTGVSVMEGIRLAASAVTIVGSHTGVADNVWGLNIVVPIIQKIGGNLGFTTYHGIEIAGGAFNTAGATIGTAYGVKIGDFTGSSITTSLLLEVGPATPYFRVEGDFTAAANATPVYISEGATPTLRQLKTKAGDTLGAGDLVCVLV